MHEQEDGVDRWFWPALLACPIFRPGKTCGVANVISLIERLVDQCHQRQILLFISWVYRFRVLCRADTFGIHNRYGLCS